MNKNLVSRGSIEHTTLLIDIATCNVVRFSPSDSVGEAARVMAEKRISSIVVVDEEGRPVGIVTERNMLHAMQSGCPIGTTLDVVMSKPIITVPKSITCLDAYQLCLRDGIRHLVIVDVEQRLFGIVSETDFRLHINLTELAGHRQVTTVMSSSVLSLSPDANLQDALDFMKSHRNGCVVVAEDECPLGIITERDIVRLYSGDLNIGRIMLRDVMISPVLTIELGCTLNEAAKYMQASRVRHLVVVNPEGHLAGLLSEHELTHAMTSGLIDSKTNSEGAFLHTLVNTIPDLVWLKDVNGVYLACNQRFELFFGAGESEIVGKTDYDFVEQELADFFRKHDRAAMAADKPSINEEWLTFASDGYRGLFETIKTPMRDSYGRLIGVLGVARDITERMKMDEMLRKLSAAVEQTAASVVITDLDACIQYVNPRFTVNTGYSAEEVIGKNPRILQSGKTDKEVYRDMWGKLTRGQEWKGELLDKRKNGELYWEDVSIAPVRSADGMVTHYVAIKTEITERKLMEVALAESEYRYRTLIENSPFCIHEIDRKGRFQSMNQAGLAMLGIGEEKSICGNSCLDIVSEYDKERIKDSLQEALNGSDMHFEFTAAGDTTTYLKSCFIPIRDADGNVIKLMGITEDITQRKDMEQQLLANTAALRHSEEKLRTLIEAIPDPIQYKDGEGRWLESNSAARQIFGLNNVDWVGKTDKELYEIVEPGFREALLECDQTDRQAWNARDVMHVEAIVPMEDGRNLFFDVIKKPLFHDDGKRAGLVVVGRDISELRESQNALLEREEMFRAIFEQVPNGVELIDLDSLRFVEANPASCRMLGYTHKEYLQLRLDDIQSDLHEDKLVEAVRKVEISGATFENRHRCKNGESLDVEVTARVLNVPGKHLLLGVWRDITESKKASALLLKQMQFSDDVINSLPGIFYLLDQQGKFIRTNPQFLKVTGYSCDEIKKLNALSFFDEKDRELVEKNMQAVFESGDASVEASLIVKSGKRISYYFYGHRTYIDDQPYLVGLGTDISERKHAEENLRIIASVFDTSQEAIIITDADNLITDVNPAFTLITGYLREEVIGRNPKLLSSGRHDHAFYAEMWRSLKQEKVWRGEIWNRRKTGAIYVELLSISAICDDQGRVQRHVGVFSDISYLKEHEAALNRIAHYDALTGIPNRMLLADRMKQAIAQTSRDGNMLAVCYLDLDGFKPVNDTLGHDAGDQVLIEIAKRLLNTVRGGDTVARLGGDEFVVLLLGLERGDECMVTLERLLSEIAQPISVKGNLLTLGASIGVSIYPLDDEVPDTLLRHADQAMYVAKQSGKNRFYIYDMAMEQRARGRQEFMKGIRSGLEQGEFELHYQPKINLNTRKLFGVEALIRWRHPERGLLLPVEFLRSIENTELDIEIGEWVIATALNQANQWHHDGLDIEVSINISAYHLESGYFVEKLRKQLDQYPNLPSGRFQIEVLETAALDDLAVVRGIIEACSQLGVKFALDDFGTGYSSLSYLSSLPVDVLKIDQSFVRDMLEDKGDMAIVHGIIALAKAFNLQIVAEGIETSAHYQALLDMGCEVGQGYDIARPMPADELISWHANVLKGIL